jgi:hypothetical protein
MALPKMVRVRQTFETVRVDDVAGETRRQLESLQLGRKVKPGQTCAITCGSRGIANIAVITKTIVDHVKSLGGAPYIVPAMGSHGGATAEGQKALIAGYGVTEERMGCEIRSSMETVIVDTTPQGIPVHFDKHASQADHVIVAGRVKPHTGFVGEIESGLHKMMLIGLGKHAGAFVYHKAIKDFSFGEIIRAVADVVLKRCRVLAGVAIIENASDETALIEAIPPETFFERESALLKIARSWLPRLPVSDVDLLIVDEIGKNISGTGMDTNVVGRKYNDHAATDLDDTRCRRIFIRSLTEATHGNACGIGLSEFTNRRTVAQIDDAYTKVNCITSGHPTAGMIPLVYDTDREAITDALETIGLTDPVNARVVQITNTLHLHDVLISEACIPNLRDQERIRVMTAPAEMQFDDAGNLKPVAVDH